MLRACVLFATLLTSCGATCPPCAPPHACARTAAPAPPMPVSPNVLLDAQMALPVGRRLFAGTALPCQAGEPVAGELFNSEDIQRFYLDRLEASNEPTDVTLLWDGGSCVGRLGTAPFRLTVVHGTAPRTRACAVAREVEGCDASDPMSWTVALVGAHRDAVWRSRRVGRAYLTGTAAAAYQELGVPIPWPSGAQTTRVLEHLFDQSDARFIQMSARVGQEEAVLTYGMRGGDIIWRDGYVGEPQGLLEVEGEPLLFTLFDEGVWQLRSMQDGRRWEGAYPIPTWDGGGP